LVDLERLQVIIQQVVEGEGMELAEVEYKGSPSRSILRIYIDKPAGITHSDCARISHQVGTRLDVEDLIAGSYLLEVSSPGLTRKLTKPADYARYRGRLAKIQTRQPVSGSRSFRGTLRGIDEQGTVTLELKNETTIQIPWQTITKANLDLDF